MALGIIRFRKDNEILWGVQEGDVFFTLQKKFANLSDLLKYSANELREMSAGSSRLAISLEEVEVLSPVTTPCQIICQGKNYLDHLLETGTKPKNKTFNILFSKAWSSVTCARGVIQKPVGVELLDYEIELALILKKEICESLNMTEDLLPEYVAGAVMANDLSARDIQVPQGQWFKGKSFRNFCPIGPVFLLFEKEDFKFLKNLDLQLSVNGKVKQKSNTSLLMYGPAETLSEISNIFTLMPGDILLTGTPGGVAMKVPSGVVRDFFSRFMSEKDRMERFIREQKESARYLQNGDLIESTIKSPCGRIDFGKQILRIKA